MRVVQLCSLSVKEKESGKYNLFNEKETNANSA